MFQAKIWIYNKPDYLTFKKLLASTDQEFIKDDNLYKTADIIENEIRDVASNSIPKRAESIYPIKVSQIDS